MATAIPFPMIKSIHGRLGNFIFYFRHGNQCIRMHAVPYNPDTEAQRIVRRTFGDAVRSWQAMDTDEKNKYNRKARFLNISGYNLYISEYMKTNISAKLKALSTSGSSDSSGTFSLKDSINSVSTPKKNKSAVSPAVKPKKSGPG
jgi:hypothetical protein